MHTCMHNYYNRWENIYRLIHYVQTTEKIYLQVWIKLLYVSCELKSTFDQMESCCWASHSAEVDLIIMNIIIIQVFDDPMNKEHFLVNKYMHWPLGHLYQSISTLTIQPSSMSVSFISLWGIHPWCLNRDKCDFTCLVTFLLLHFCTKQLLLANSSQSDVVAFLW